MEYNEVNNENLDNTKDDRMTVLSDSSQSLPQGKRKETKLVTSGKCKTVTKSVDPAEEKLINILETSIKEIVMHDEDDMFCLHLAGTLKKLDPQKEYKESCRCAILFMMCS